MREVLTASKEFLMLEEPTSAPRTALPTEQNLPDNQQSTLGSFVIRCKRKILAFVDRPLRYLFGRDIFISYSRRDAGNYVPKLANVLRSEIPKLSLYLDRWVAPPSGELPASMRRHLRWSSLLVVIASENALKSRFVKEEIRRFAETGRQIIPISIDGKWEKIDWSQDPWRDVRGAAPEREDGSNVENGTPSGAVIDRIKNSTLFTRQDQRLRRAVNGTVIGILILIVGAIGFSSVIIRSARAEANNRIVDAQ
jgi:TIR domain-containing protein